MELKFEIAPGEKVNTEKLTAELKEFGLNMGVKWDDSGQALAVVLVVPDETDKKKVEKIISDHVLTTDKTDFEEMAEKEALPKLTLENAFKAIEELNIRITEAGIK